MKRIILFLLIATPLLSACHGGFRINRTSYVQAYTEYSARLLVNLQTKDNSVTGFYVSAIPQGRYADIRSEGEDKEWFDELCEQHSDISYNYSGPNIGYDWVYEFYPWCISPDISAVDVITERYFDNNHPAGSSIADCLDVTFESANRFIQEGYPKGRENDHIGIITKVLKDVLPEDLVLLVNVEHLLTFSFRTYPEDTETYLLRIVCNDVNGRQITGTLDYHDGVTFDTD